jgi:GH25 family lysozyme M1 (1,4-beta-N-acetylmuramidase)
MTVRLRVDGVDLSHWQSGQLDFHRAKDAGVKWVYHKATEGDGYRDPNYNARRREAALAGVPFGAYHFARPELGDAAAEARHFLSYAEPMPGDLRPALDIETMEGLSLDQIRTWCATWIGVVRSALGVDPVVYTPYDLGKMQDSLTMWRPRYNIHGIPPDLPCDIWQFSDGKIGNPNSVAGFGNVDLNMQRANLTVNDLIIPAADEPVKKTLRMHGMHASLQYSDSTAQQREDLRRIFGRAAEREVAWATGTEAGPGAGAQRELLDEIGRDHGYRVFIPNRPTDTWVAVRRERINGSWESGHVPVVPGSGQLPDAITSGKRWGPKGITWASWNDAQLGRTVTIGAAHYLTDAREPSSPRWALNRQLAKAAGELARERGQGKAIVFYGGDQNMADNKNGEPQGDTFFGQPLTSAWDELGKWSGTGHGNIDVLASYDADRAVSAAYIRSLGDAKFPLHTDHFLVEAGFDVVTRV